MAQITFNRIAIIGVGLIGGSWGLGLKQLGHKGTRVGCDRPAVLETAVAAGAIDAGEADPLQAARLADLVILASPIGAILDLLPRLAAVVPPGALVTDVGSAKFLIVQRAREVFQAAPLFLGGHPLAGKERSGIEHAEAALFENACYALVPLSSNHLHDSRVTAFRDLLVSMKARPWVTDASTHDRAAAYLSHLPQLISTGLASLIQEKQAAHAVEMELAAAGFRDVTRLAESPYPLWRDICQANRANIEEALAAFIGKLQSLKDGLADRTLEHEFEQAARLRRIIS